ncbi:hypothetical protein GGF37_006140 [Kickxella alabastrina]|nr:hypothetical protein GGF37_006140 [Kickxella alabastrina]
MTTNTEVASLAELVAKRLPLSEKEKLVNDVRIGLDLTFARLEEHTREQSIEESRQGSLTKEIQTLSLTIDKRLTRIECLEALQQSIAAARAASGTIQLSTAAGEKPDFSALHNAYADIHRLAKQIEARCEFDAWGEFQLEKVVTSTLYPHLTTLFRAWTPTDYPQLLNQVLAPLRAYVRTSDTSMAANEMTPYESLLNKTLVPRLRRFVFTEWDPMADSMAQLLDELPPVITAVLSNDIGAVLQRCIDAINPRTVMESYRRTLAGPESSVTEARSNQLAALRIDHVVIPWLPFVYSHAELMSSVRRKLCAALDLWVPSRESNSDIISIISPWTELFQGKELRRLSAKVVERLEGMLRAEFEFNAQRQTTWPFKVLLKWHSHLPFTDWFALVKRRILSAFIDYLRRWLEDPRANYAEIAEWYWQWKILYPAAIFERAEVQREFKKALVLMTLAMSQRDSSPPSHSHLL